MYADDSWLILLFTRYAECTLTVVVGLLMIWFFNPKETVFVVFSNPQINEITMYLNRQHVDRL